MSLKKIEIENFRMLRSTSMSVEEQATVIVGRNNAGKTSLTELFKRFFSDNPRFKLIDFSLSALDEFWESYQLYNAGDLDAALEKLPKITLRLEFDYSTGGNFGPLSELVIDFDAMCTTAIAVMSHEPKEFAFKTLFDDLEPKGTIDKDRKRAFFKEIQKRIHLAYGTYAKAIDPTDNTNTKDLELSKVRRIVGISDIPAQRGLDDKTIGEKEVLGKVLRKLYANATEETASEEAQEAYQALNDSIGIVQEEIDSNFSIHLAKLLPTIKQFGYPGLLETNLATETALEIDSLLQNSTKVRYKTNHLLNLPEAYNGLGARNLIYILLQIHEFYQDYIATGVAPNTHLIFIEEPEAHLHPQMQETFIRHLQTLAVQLPKNQKKKDKWNVQFIVSTHSSHIANEAPFNCIRYFANRDLAPIPTQDLVDFKNVKSELGNQIGYTRIKDLKSGPDNKDWTENQDFLHKYLTLTRCDLFFADKVILIEGTSERLLLPEMIKRGDLAVSQSNRLTSQYITILEVGGAYAQKFFGLLDFLEIPSLIITDIDSGKGSKGNACRVENGEKTTNACLKSVFGKGVTPSQLLKLSAKQKTIKDNRRIAFQVPESEKARCGRSFEEAFILTNPSHFTVTDGGEFDLAKTFTKTDFALKFAIEETKWQVPKYIEEGLEWLRSINLSDNSISKEEEE